MRPPQHLIESLWFLFGSDDEFRNALSVAVDEEERNHITFLSSRGLPPVTSIEAVATLIGVNSGIVWSFILRPERYYRKFVLESGRKHRLIMAPRVGLKLIQKWMSFHLSRVIPIHPHVFGFVPGRSHIDAAFTHRSAEWAYSVDITDFFQSTPRSLVAEALQSIGYIGASADLVSRLSCVHERLAQGAPSSPALSNLVFYEMDAALATLAKHHNAELSRFADDIVFSGKGHFPAQLKEDVHALFELGPWALAPQKERLEPIKGRIKVHGLIVNGARVRTTKGYRNKLRAYKHILETRGALAENPIQLRGHIGYASQVERRLHYLYAEGIPVPDRPLQVSVSMAVARSAAHQDRSSDDSPTSFRTFINHLLARLR